MTAPSRSDILALCKKRPLTSAQIKSFYPREDRGNITADIITLLNLGMLEAQGGTVCDGPTYVITKKGESALNEL